MIIVSREKAAELKEQLEIFAHKKKYGWDTCDNLNETDLLIDLLSNIVEVLTTEARNTPTVRPEDKHHNDFKFAIPTGHPDAKYLHGEVMTIKKIKN